MPFDKIIMNPPYDKNLHLKILREAMKHIEKEGGEVINLSPIRWLQDPSGSYKKGSDFNKFEDIKAHIADIDVIKRKDAFRLFNAGFRHDLGIYYITKDGGFDCENFWRTNVSKATLKVIENIGIPVYTNKTIPSISSMFGKNSDYPYWIRCPRVHGHMDAKDEYDLVAPDIKWSLNVEDKEGKQVYFKTEEEARNFFETLKSPLYKFIKKVGFYSTTNSYTGMPFLPTYKKPWTDADFYEYFDFNEEEIVTIEEEMK